MLRVCTVTMPTTMVALEIRVGGGGGGGGDQLTEHRSRNLYLKL